MIQDIKTKPLNFGRAAFVQSTILGMDGSREHSRDRQAVINSIGKIWGCLEAGRDLPPTEGEIKRDEALPETCLTLTSEQWHALKTGCIKILIGTKSENDKSKVLAFAKIIRAYNECWKSLPAGETPTGTPDGEEEPSPDSEPDAEK